MGVVEKVDSIKYSLQDDKEFADKTIEKPLTLDLDLIYKHLYQRHLTFQKDVTNPSYTNKYKVIAVPNLADSLVLTNFDQYS